MNASLKDDSATFLSYMEGNIPAHLGTGVMKKIFKMENSVAEQVKLAKLAL